MVTMVIKTIKTSHSLSPIHDGRLNVVVDRQIGSSSNNRVKVNANIDSCRHASLAVTLRDVVV